MVQLGVAWRRSSSTASGSFGLTVRCFLPPASWLVEVCTDDEADGRVKVAVSAPLVGPAGICADPEIAAPVSGGLLLKRDGLNDLTEVVRAMAAEGVVAVADADGLEEKPTAAETAGAGKPASTVDSWISFDFEELAVPVAAVDTSNATNAGTRTEAFDTGIWSEAGAVVVDTAVPDDETPVARGCPDVEIAVVRSELLGATDRRADTIFPDER